MLFFVITQIGMSWVGYTQENNERLQHGRTAIDYPAYLMSDSFLEATMENWESEFLQMFAYVIFTVFLFQKGSAESKPMQDLVSVDADPRASSDPNAPWPVRKGGLTLRLYENSLSIVLFALFLISFFLHAVGGAGKYSEEQLMHGGNAVSISQYMLSAQFWFESLQNWQSEFFSIGMMVLLTTWLRQRGSPESKPVAMAHDQSP